MTTYDIDRQPHHSRHLAVDPALDAREEHCGTLLPLDIAQGEPAAANDLDRAGKRLAPLAATHNPETKQRRTQKHKARGFRHLKGSK